MDTGRLLKWGGGLFACLLIGALACAPGKKDVNPLETLASLIEPRPAYVQTYLVETQDHWRLALHRYEPKRPDPSRMPVLLCHGLGYNGRFWDLDEENSFAQFLSDAGWDTWILDLRGGGSSSLPLWYVFRGLDLNLVKNLQIDLTKFGWTVDDYILKDAPAAVDLVRKVTGAPRVAWVGHSLGGMIGIGFLERMPDSGVGCLVAVAAPMFVPKPRTLFQRQSEDMRPLILAVNNRWYALGQTLTLDAVKTPVDTFFYNAKNMDPVTVRQLYMRVAEDVPASIVDQLLKMDKVGEFISADEKFNYTKEIPRLTLPALFIAGRVDVAADPEIVRWAYERTSSPDKTFREFGLVWGHSADYGHDDLILGRRSRDEVFPVIEQWLEGRARVAVPPAKKE